ncbi:Uncharacterized protein MNEG_5891 [Monoraphidium neglectum]|uniref:GPI-anchored wall transfer protein 1 n=1 Tax=Monoraphidium neglectum TaxID=145388 RepID=A0A0D2N8L0_9CHLO|nr:Uncharacterized protein MNEG_5891 [Monoraphidium neglectum]KIZ02066.1 Uncharacterized protein MNEG_5891 [Monoraphidium neglectum]|eukprot:XP_013901085.1 Uncharacterized protein MNEG_5891 [Monoraphidium neglectum]
MSAADAVPVFLMLLLLWVSVALKIWLKMLRGPGARQQLALVAQHVGEPRKRFVSAFRGATTLLTALGILAVDFQAFPRRYAKAERHGQGLMDAGVGAVVFAGGLVSKAALADAAASRGALRRVLSGLRSAAPLLALGLARLLATRAAGYQQHVGEYGVHWNFFLTAAAVGLLTLAVRVPRRLLLPVGLLVAAAHQAALSLGGLSDWVHSEERGPGWVSLNKEGVASVAGYWAIHLLGAAAGEHLRGSCAAASAGVRARLTVPHKRGGGAGAGGGGGGGGGSGHEGGVGAASQALACNAAYVLWVSAQCGASLAMCLITDAVSTALVGAPPHRTLPLPPGPSGPGGPGAPSSSGSSGGGAAGASGYGAPLLLEAFNRNMLALFLAANLATGAVNLGVDTLSVGHGAARAIVGTYLVAVCLLAVALDALNITLKL